MFAARGELAHPSGANENAGARSARHELFCRLPARDRRSRPADAKAIPSPPPDGEIERFFGKLMELTVEKLLNKFGAGNQVLF